MTEEKKEFVKKEDSKFLSPFGDNGVLVSYFGKNSKGKLIEVSFFMPLDTFEEKKELLEEDKLIGKQAIIALEKVGADKDVILIVWNAGNFSLLKGLDMSGMDTSIDRKEVCAS